MRRRRSIDPGSRSSTRAGNGLGGAGVAGLLVVALAVFGCSGTPTADPLNREPPPRESPSAPALWFGGDVHFGASGPVGLGDIPASLGGAVGVVNLEGPISTGPGGAEDRGGEVVLSNPADSGERLRALGIGAVSVANNHSSDAGVEGRRRTWDALERAGVVPAASEGSAFSVGAAAVRLVAIELDPEGISWPRDTAEVRPVEEVEVLSVHVTGPPSYLPSPALERMVDVAVAYGTDIVVVHGTHVLGRVERRDDTVIAWGLGNLLFNCSCTRETEGLILRVELTPGLPASVLPVRAGLGGASAARHPDAAGIFTLLHGLGGAPLAGAGAWRRL